MGSALRALAAVRFMRSQQRMAHLSPEEHRVGRVFQGRHPATQILDVIEVIRNRLTNDVCAAALARGELLLLLNPLGWRDLRRWLLEQLPEGGPETPRRLVMELVGDQEPANGLRLGLSLAEEGLLVEQPRVLIELGSAAEALCHELQPGLNAVVVPCSAPAARGVAVDQRRLMEVLMDLETVCSGASLAADC